MANATLEQLFDAPFTFQRRPRAVPCDLRPVWRLHALLLILEKCWGGQASLEQLHVLNWASRTDETRRAFLDFIKGKRTPSQVIVRYDPSLNRAVHFAFAEGLVVRHEIQQTLTGDSNGPTPPYRIILSEKGRTVLQQIHQMDDCFVVLKRFLASIPHKVSQTQVQMLFSWGATL